MVKKKDADKYFHLISKQGKTPHHTDYTEHLKDFMYLFFLPIRGFDPLHVRKFVILIGSHPFLRQGCNGIDEK